MSSALTRENLFLSKWLTVSVFRCEIIFKQLAINEPLIKYFYYFFLILYAFFNTQEMKTPQFILEYFILMLYKKKLKLNTKMCKNCIFAHKKLLLFV